MSLFDHVFIELAEAHSFVERHEFILINIEMIQKNQLSLFWF